MDFNAIDKIHFGITIAIARTCMAPPVPYVKDRVVGVYATYLPGKLINFFGKDD